MLTLQSVCYFGRKGHAFADLIPPHLRTESFITELVFAPSSKGQLQRNKVLRLSLDRVSEARESWGRGRTVFVGMTAPDPTGGQGDAMWSGGGRVIHLITGLTTSTPRRRVGSTLFHTRRPGICQTLTG